MCPKDSMASTKSFLKFCKVLYENEGRVCMEMSLLGPSTNKMHLIMIGGEEARW